ncbi:hypothetical protein GALL_454750 [mine drainage metagenome]|uniref:Uncharacterized protein n=1 Tax=mine drainage metagenome TaxID=410659 RepID=A0A1J5PMW8_9ZZZZ
MTGSAKQSVGAAKKEWIASSLTLPCANASRLPQAMTDDAYIRSNSCLIIPVIRPLGDSISSMMVK